MNNSFKPGILILIKEFNPVVIKGLFEQIDINKRSIISFKNLDEFKANNKSGKDYSLEFMEYLLEANEGYVS
jgi:hypothetical protein